jgi:hypothetical protein
LAPDADIAAVPSRGEEQKAMEITIGAEIPAEETQYPTRPGITRAQFLLTCEAEDGLTFRLVRSEYQDGENAFQTPRHHHAFQQVRFAEAGLVNYAPGKDIPAGDIAYFPRGAYYGPQRKDNGIGITIQFGFGSEMPGGKDSMRVYYDGMEKLAAHARVEDGLVIDTDPVTGEERRRETWQAVAEEFSGHKFAIPAEGYRAPILMHPAAFAYHEVAPGVEIRRLGSFYDHAGPNADLRIAMIRLSDGGVYRLDPERAQTAWTLAPGLQIEGRAYPGLTSFYSPRGEDAMISGIDGVELYLIEFPRLD